MAAFPTYSGSGRTTGENRSRAAFLVLKSGSEPGSVAEQLELTADPARAALHVSYTLPEPATTEVLLCDTLGRVWATPLPAACRPAGRYTHHASLGQLPPARYLLVFYCNGVRIKATYLMAGR